MLHRLKQLARKAQRAAAKRNPRRVEIVLYHFVTDESIPFAEQGHNVRPAEFEKQLEYLQQNYEIIALEDAPSVVSERTEFEKPVVCVCFDDGYQSNLTEALPILRKREIPATIFINPSVLGNADLLWRDKIRYLVDEKLDDEFVEFLKNGDTSDAYNFESLSTLSFYRWSKSPDGISDMTIQEDLKKFFPHKGIDTAAMAAEHDLFMAADEIHPNHEGLNFGNHTWSHPLMTLLDRDAQLEQIQKADDWLKERGIDAKALAMPFTPFNDDTLSIIGDLNYDCLLTVYAKSNPPSQNGSGPLTLHRWLAPSTAAEFKSLL